MIMSEPGYWHLRLPHEPLTIRKRHETTVDDDTLLDPGAVPVKKSLGFREQPRMSARCSPMVRWLRPANVCRLSGGEAPDARGGKRHAACRN